MARSSRPSFRRTKVLLCLGRAIGFTDRGITKLGLRTTERTAPQAAWAPFARLVRPTGNVLAHPDLGKLPHMPKVDPETHQPLSDAPDQASDDLRGGRGRDDTKDGANPTGSGAASQQGLTDSESAATSPGSTDAGSAD